MITPCPACVREGRRLRDKRLIGFVHAALDGATHAFVLDREWLHVDYLPHLEEFYRGCGFRCRARACFS